MSISIYLIDTQSACYYHNANINLIQSNKIAVFICKIRKIKKDMAAKALKRKYKT